MRNKRKTILSLIIFLPTSFSLSNEVTSSFAPKINIYAQNKVKETSTDINEDNSFSITSNGEKYFVSLIFSENNYKGFKVLDANNRVISLYIGSYKPNKNSSLDSLSPYFGNGTPITAKQQELINKYSLTNTQYYDFPYVNEKLYEKTFDNYSTYHLLKNAPEYYQYPVMAYNNGCVIASSAMLISFYDRNTNLTNLVDGLLPLNHYDDVESVNILGDELAERFGWTLENGVFLGTAVGEITKYFSEKGYFRYTCFTSNDFAFFRNVITEYRNPAIVWLDTNSELYHAVLAFGWASIYNVGVMIATHYTWPTMHTGTYYVNSDLFYTGVYIGASL